MRIWLAVSLSVLLGALPTHAQGTLPPMAASASPSFEVATIRPTDPTSPTYKRFLISGGRRLTTSNTTLNDLIAWGYVLHVTQIIGGPRWVETDKYDVRSVVDRPVVDQTGLAGKYDLSLKWTPVDAPPATDAPPDLYTAIQEQLGLKLVATKTLHEVFVIDHVERPSQN